MNQMSDAISKKTEKTVHDRMINGTRWFFFVYLVVIFIGLIYYCAKDKVVPIEYSDSMYISRWVVTDPNGTEHEEGDTYVLDKYSSETYETRSTLPENIIDGSWLVFTTSSDTTVYIDGEFRKDFINDRDVVTPGGCVKRFYLLVPVYASDSGKEVKIVRDGTARQGQLYAETFVGDTLALLHYFMGSFFLTMMLAVILAVFSFVIMLISIVMMVLYKQRIEMFYGALGIFLVSVWAISNSYLYPFVFGHYHVDGLLNYMMCLMIPFSLILYLNDLQRGRYKAVTSMVLTLSIVNSVVWPVLHFTGVMAFSTSLNYINVVLAIQVIAVFSIITIDIIKGKAVEYKATAFGFGAFLVCCFVELMVLNFTLIKHDEIPMLIGLAFLLASSVVQQMDDIRRIRDERQKAIELSQAKTRFLAGMSHEIRTPINAILGMNEMILRESNDPVISDYAESVKSSGKMLLMLVNDVLDFSKIEAGKMEIANAQFRMSALLRDIVPMLRERADEKNLELKVALIGDVPDGLISDEFRIRQILINLINNGIKYTDIGSVTLEIGGKYLDPGRFKLVLNVRDTGRGIREEEQKNLFEAFTRADMKKNGNIEGTGLGLSIVKNIVDSMDGEINVESKYGEGSVFTVSIPVDVYNKDLLKMNFMENTDNTSSAEEDCDYKAPDAKILAVDDNNSNLKIVKFFLKRAGIVPDTCDGGLKALELCKQKKYDLILLDHMMPEPDGIETLRLIKEDSESKNKDTKVIVLTANAIAGSRKTYIEAGFEDYLTKPIDSRLLEQTVKKYLPEDKVIQTSTPVEKTPEPAAEKPVEKPAEKQDIEARLKSIDGLDYDTALEYSGDDKEILEEVVNTICENCESSVTILRKTLEAGDMEAYRREAHSVKGLMATIGLAALSDRAKDHEYAARDNNAEFIKADFEEFIEEYRSVCKKLGG